MKIIIIIMTNDDGFPLKSPVFLSNFDATYTVMDKMFL
jgi:hypothetical protein